ncbi:PQQ-binding-like beta-propeller repeat protein [Tuwongella immobilis]|uniref:Pyrrolo-quinoline quinone repeat domain-containing protein n=1 Tax=Tuwongella immobilis TaxID=692036 RepID=A0A6C2YT89_9BACT|nr:PQQ-binding-like beta-propeller repeat protein [Tuwongella immobilis]VIP04249.1 Probable serine/threonine protein kinase afsK OS=Blastopirellula marina DSM 3645 GN=DSM3645_12411 PE=4 SV=1: PQQ_2 [Tuwongella immobilis]VTS05861.1 Probable serine/threonine protein kinase afsK OS=Blastopirellula marina DSM 3645 GN=DSM3645_12411 PE=4 SV=1: PQQ_2 [Tuwongella immobilis]
MTRWAWGWMALLPMMLIAADWPQWRGPNLDGVAQDGTYPTEWDGTKGTNIAWKMPLPGAGNSSPVIVGEDLFLTATSGAKHGELHLLCYARGDGKLRWQTDFTATPADAPFKMFPPERGHAASTVAVSGNSVVALFGTGDLVCVDRTGKPIWMRSLTSEYGVIRNDYGIAASPIITDGKVIVQIDHLEGSYLLAADLATGKTVWRAVRSGIFDNWSTPVPAMVGGSKQVIVLGTGKIIGYDVATGAVKWTIPGLERLCSCTPILRGDRLFAVSGPAGATLAIDLSAAPTPKILWESKKTGPFVPSAIVVGEHYFFSNDQATAYCMDLKTGEEKWRERLGSGRMRPSPVATRDAIYFTALDGVTTVIPTTGEFDVLAKNPLGEEVAASFALVDGAIYIRGDKHLWCIRK